MVAAKEASPKYRAKTVARTARQTQTAQSPPMTEEKKRNIWLKIEHIVVIFLICAL